MLNTDNANNAWIRLLNDIRRDGNTVKPRDMPTLELLANQTVVDMNAPIVTVKARKVSYQFMFAEAWHILSGREDVESLLPYSPSIGRFSDNGTTFEGAYGPRVVRQLNYAVKCLIADEDSRQAVITIFSPNPAPSKDIPCTLSLEFLVRDKKLHCIASMRSSDAWIGYIYDVFNFSAIAAYIMLEVNALSSLNISLGNLYLTAGSQHLYEDKYERARDIVSSIHNPEAEVFNAYPIDFPDLLSHCNEGSDLVMLLEELKDHLYE